MFAFTACSRDRDGSVRPTSLRQVEADGIWAVYADYEGQNVLDPEEALRVRIDLDGEVTDILTISEMSPFWTEPRFAASWKDVPDRTGCVLCRKSDGSYAAVVPVVDKTYKTELCGQEDASCGPENATCGPDDVTSGSGDATCGREEATCGPDGALFARTYSWYEGLKSCKDLLFVCGEGTDPFRLLSDCYRTVARLLGNRCRTREERSYPEFLEYLGWCSWDSMQIRVNEEGLRQKCEEFKAKGIPVRWAILDDMWAEIRDFYGKEYADKHTMIELMHASRMYSYTADPFRFPSGLKATVEMIHSYGIEVGMWLPSTGYWSGLDPEGDAYQKLSPYTLTTQEGKVVPSYDPSLSYRFYRTIFDSFRKAGADFVKIDNQSMPRRHYKGLAPIGEVARGIGSGIESSVGEAFCGRMINCMGMAEETMWNRSASAVSRCSDDFQPENRAWFRKHILQCTYNGLTQGQLYYNDYDMWWTDDEQAGKNSVLRAVSGGPVYISDEIGRSRKEALEPLILSDGRILRCKRPGLPTEDCLLADPGSSGKPFKVQNTVNGSGVIAVFNLSRDENRSVTGTVSPSDVWEIADGDSTADSEYAVYEHFSGEYTILRRDESIEIHLADADDYRRYVIVPLVDGFGAIGRTDKFISPATVLYAEPGQIILKEKGPYAYVRDGKLMRKDSSTD